MLDFEWTKKHTTVLFYTCGTIVLAVMIVLALLFPGSITGFLAKLFSAVSPVFFGFVIAYLMHPICDFFEKKVFSKLTLKKKFLRVVSVICSLLVVLAVIGLFIGMMVPNVVNSYLDLEKRFEIYIADAVEFVNKAIVELQKNDTHGLLSDFLSTEKLTGSVDSMLGSAIGYIGNFANTVVSLSSKIIVVAANVIVSFIFAVYFLIEKEILFKWTAKLSTSLFSEKFNAGAKKWIKYTDGVFSSFITGKIVNALIITVINFIVFGLFKIPYAPLIALVTGVTDMIPYFGPFIGAIPCAFIILIAEPSKVLVFGILVLVIQQIDGNIVGPKILCEKVGVDSLLIIVAITIGGGLFGIVGMFVGVPVFTVLYNVVMEFLNSRLKKKSADNGIKKEAVE